MSTSPAAKPAKPDKVELFREAVRALPEGTPEELVRYIEQTHHVTVNPAFAPVYRACLLQRDALAFAARPPESESDTAAA